jgi:CBS domain-containing protein
VTDMHPRMVMHPYRPELVGADLRDYVDPEDKGGRRLFVELRALVEEANEGYLEYMWQWKDDPTHLEPKLSYVKGIPEWGWIIGTGIYIHDVEAEMARLSRNLLVADGVIAVALLAVLTNIVFQSRRMEMNRTRAEMGLREAKERYRALVESSNEGYVLVLDGEMVYSNHAMQRMTGYEAPELLGPRLLDLFAEESGRGVERLRRLLRGEVNRADFEAVLQTKSGATLEVYVSTARLFFSEKNGYVITFVPLARGAREALDAAYRMHAVPAAPVGSGAVTANLAQLIAESSSVGEVVQALRLLPVSVQSMTARGVRSDVLRKKVGGVYDAAVRRFIELSLAVMGEPPVAFAYLSLGSSARHDMTLFADQDSALVFADVPRERLNEVRRWFLRLADEVCGRLNQAGYPYCGGGIMAANPKWCLSMSEWRAHFRSWILEASPDSILEMNVFLDLRCGYGEKALVDALNEEVLTLTRQNPEFFIHYARNCLLYRAPLGLFGKLRTERQGNRRTINVKESLRPIEMFARIYALKYGIKEPGTLARLEALGRMEVLPKESVRELVYVLDYLWQLRFYNQIRANLELGSSAEDLDIEPFTEVERENLKTVLSRIALFQSRLSYEFLGVAQG